MLNVVMLHVVMMSHYAECHYAERRYAECLAEFRLRRGTHFSSYAESLF